MLAAFPRGEVDDKIWVPVVDGPPAYVVRRSPPSLTLARDAVEEQAPLAPYLLGLEVCVYREIGRERKVLEREWERDIEIEKGKERGTERLKARARARALSL